MNFQCHKIPDNCATVDTATGLCKTCVDNFHELTADKSKCTKIIVKCAPGQYPKGLACLNIPPECTDFDTALEKCKTCIRGYKSENGVCTLIKCPSRFVPNEEGECVPVSPLCGEYDPITGNCFTCSQAGYVPTANGCKQRTSPLASCRGREAMGYGKCRDAQKNCKDYNLVTLECDRCMDNFEKDYTGICVIKAACT